MANHKKLFSAKDISNLMPETIQVRAGENRSKFDETSEALYLTSGFVYKDCKSAEDAFNGNNARYVYGRYANPTNTMFEQKMAAVEGAKFCAGLASGMAAVTAALVSHLSPNDRIVCAKALFGNCFWIVNDLLPRLNVEVVWVDGFDLTQWKQALSVPTDAVFFETPSNPTMKLVDIKAVCALAKKAGAMTFVDNVFATPIGQKPLEMGADVVIYSTTKHIDGQGRCLGGVVLCNNEQWFEEVLYTYIKNTGPSLSPFNSWVMLKGLETLSLRMQRQSSNALELARFLEGLKGVKKIIYPGLESHPQFNLAKQQMECFGTLIGIYVDGDKDDTYKVLDNLNIVDISNNLGDTKSLIISPLKTTHSKLSPIDLISADITENFVRLSVGLEHIDDLKNDFSSAFAKAFEK